MDRYLIVVGDAPTCGGAVLPYESELTSTMNGHCVAFIGGRVYCAGCHSVGLIAKAGGPYRMRHCEAEQAMEGDVVVCRCPVPPLLVSSRQRLVTCDDHSGVEGAFHAYAAGAAWYRPDPQALTASKKVLDEAVTHLPEEHSAMTFCPNMSDAKFLENIMKIRDRAVYLVLRKIGHLSKWDDAAQKDVFTWFGRSDQETREFLSEGLARAARALKGLTAQNFARYSQEFAGRIACELSKEPFVVAAVCKSDVKNRVIGIARGFCELVDESIDKPSKVGTLIHEITHFDDVFSTDDPVYGHIWAMRGAQIDREMPRKNADSISGYVMWGVVYGV